MIRNLLSNALKYTKCGKLLFGCRRRGEILRVEIWDTGIGIPEQDLQAIFDEYYQLGNATRERSLGLGLDCPLCSALRACSVTRCVFARSPARALSSRSTSCLPRVRSHRIKAFRRRR